MSSPTDFKSYKAAAVIPAKTIVKFTANWQEVTPATASSDAIAGVAELGAAAIGDMCDVAEGDWHEVTLGATVAAGDFLTSDANGKAVKAVKGGAGSYVNVFGRANRAGVAGDIVPYVVGFFTIAG